MAQFKYKAQTEDGKTVRGLMSAGDQADLQLKLKENGTYLLTAKEVDERKKGVQFKPRALSEFSRELGTLVGSGVTLVRALNIISNSEAIKPKEKKVYEDMLKQVRRGISLSDAMEAENGIFPPLMVYMFRSAESSGNMDKVALQMAAHYEKDHKLNAKISSAMVYPKILGAMIVGVVMILMKFVMPQFAELFATMDTLPISTAILMGISDVVGQWWYILIVIAIGLWIAWKALLRLDDFREKWHMLVLHIPVFGKLQQTICTSRFARTLSSLYAAGIPIVAALQIARRTIGNDYIDAQFDNVIPFVRAGNNLSDGLDMVDGFTRKLTDSVRVGEETGSLDNMLAHTADALEYDADMAITKMVSYVEPCMLIIMGIVVAFVLVSVFSALYGSYDSISGMS